MKGYYQCPLDQGSQLLTTFVMAFGRFKCLCLLYGISSASEHYGGHMYKAAFHSLSGFHHMVDVIDAVMPHNMLHMSGNC